MKRRIGFVSNSSSCSFLVYVSKVNDNKDIDAIIQDYNPQVPELSEYISNDLVLLTKPHLKLLIDTNDTYMFDSDFAGGISLESLYNSLDDSDIILCLHNYNEQGDYAYYRDSEDPDGWGELDYDNISEKDLLDESVLSLISKLSHDYRLSSINYFFGAGRNG